MAWNPLRVLLRYGYLHTRRVAGFLLAVASVAFFVHLVSISEQAQRLEDLCVGVPAAKFPEASRLGGYCNEAASISVDSVDGEELRCLVEGGDYELIQVIGVYRHGQRAPITPVAPLSDPNKFVCGLASTDRKWSGLDDVVLKRLASDGKGEKKRLTFPLHPGKKGVTCLAGQLTAVGFEQMSTLGEHFRRQYVDSGVMAGLKQKQQLHAWNVHIRSTAANRCMRSAAAFATGLLVGEEVSVFVHADSQFRVFSNGLDRKDKFTGLDLKCSSRAPSIVKSIHASSLYQDTVRQTADPMMMQFSKILNLSRARMPLLTELCDNIQGSHCVDPTAALPCLDKEHCITPELVRKTVAACDVVYALNYSLPYSEILAYPLLQQVVLHIDRRLRQFAQSQTVQATDQPFVLFFGHETTLIPLLTVLRSFDGVWPPLASRLMFELWRCRLPSCQMHKVRILYNGKALQGEVTDVLGFINLPALQRLVDRLHSQFVEKCGRP